MLYDAINIIIMCYMMQLTFVLYAAISTHVPNDTIDLRCMTQLTYGRSVCPLVMVYTPLVLLEVGILVKLCHVLKC